MHAVRNLGTSPFQIYLAYSLWMEHNLPLPLPPKSTQVNAFFVKVKLHGLVTSPELKAVLDTNKRKSYKTQSSENMKHIIFLKNIFSM